MTIHVGEIETTSLLRSPSNPKRSIQNVSGFCLLPMIVAWLSSTIYMCFLGHTILHGLRQVSQRDDIPPINFLPKGYSLTKLSTSSPPQGSSGVSILVVYLDGHEHQRLMAHEVARGVLSVLQPQQLGIAEIRTTRTANFVNVLESDAIVIGSPVYNANTHPNVQKWINMWNMESDLSNKIGAAFVTAGGLSAGQESVMLSLLKSMLVFRMIIVGGDSWESAFGASAVVYEDPFGSQQEGYFPAQCYTGDSEIHPIFLDKAFQLGARVAKITTHVKAGSNKK